MIKSIKQQHKTSHTDVELEIVEKLDFGKHKRMVYRILNDGHYKMGIADFEKGTLGLYRNMGGGRATDSLAHPTVFSEDDGDYFVFTLDTIGLEYYKIKVVYGGYHYDDDNNYVVDYYEEQESMLDRGLKTVSFKMPDNVKNDFCYNQKRFPNVVLLYGEDGEMAFDVLFDNNWRQELGVKSNE